jgi:phage terminase large subunit-like protein
LPPDPWQAAVLSDWLGRDRSNKWSASRCGLAVPRQNGKNAILEMRELFGLVFLGERFLHTAHEVKTARKAFKRLQYFFGEHRDDPAAKFPELNALVTEVRNANGQEALYLENGGSVEFIARSKGSGRGFTVDVIVMDEAQELSDDALAALMPTVSAAPLGNPQLIFTGTPPAPSMNGEVWVRTRETGLKGEDGRLAWSEWSCDLDADLDDTANWARSNPALGGRLALSTIGDERAQMDDDTFARERLGVWTDPASEQAAVDYGRWLDLTDPAMELEHVTAFAVEVSIDRAWASIAAAGPCDGRIGVELVDRRRGTGWVLPRLGDLVRRNGGVAAVDAGSPAGSLITDLEAEGFTTAIMGTKEVATACGAMVDAVNEGTVIHGPQADLNAQVETARKRPLGDGAFAFGRKASLGDVDAFNAVTFARWAAVEHEGIGPDDIYIGSWR